MKFRILIFMMVLTGLSLVSCKTTFKEVPSLMPVKNKKIQNLGRAEGKNSAPSILGLWMIGKPDTRSAIKEAVDSKKGDTLINVKSYETTYWFLLFSLTRVTVEGDVIKITGEKNEKKRRKSKRRYKRK